MKQICGETSALFSLSAKELAALLGRVREGQFEHPVAVHSEGPMGGLVQFRSFEEAMLVKLAIV
ncbi:hypothetical protein PX554_22825 [Sphingomonas sp. H39-1-10]|uniref:hypothetical protein n=1 Tax=Sphingomonas pollutisoli TaxID=3030829 RepID=UPI0023B98470|nr:hypothetical protein [Sphingomonas pollutisoli]MDF0490962.1 hypothetical protein [Sphingomonas pollutisoli]